MSVPVVVVEADMIPEKVGGSSKEQIVFVAGDKEKMEVSNRIERR